MSTQSNESKTDDNDGVLEKNVTDLLGSAQAPPRIDDVARARMRASLLAKHQVARSSKRPLWIAAGVALAAAASVALWQVSARRSSGTAQVIDQPAVASSADIKTFADGTKVWLRQGATVTELGPRHVRITGEVLFDVTPGAAPFTVDSDAAKITVLGTRFVVAAMPDTTSAAVIRGTVKLATDKGDVTLHAGDQGQAKAHTAPVRGPAPRLSQLVGWAQQARARDERGLRTSIRNGTLYARLPNSQTVESPLPMAEFHIDAVVENRVARIALDQTFTNPMSYEQEGMYRFSIPADAALQRFAMYVDGKLTESVVTDRMRARRVYEDLVYRRIDPGLLEYAGAGKLEMKIYPLRANADKRLAVVYTQSLPVVYDTWTLRVPIPDVDEPIGKVTFAVRIANCSNCEIESTSHQINVTRQGDDAMISYQASKTLAGDSLVLSVRDTAPKATLATMDEGQQHYMLVRAPLKLPTVAHTYVPRSWVIVNDVSASRSAMERRAQAAVIDRALQEIDEDDQVTVVASDVESKVLLPWVKVRAANRKKLAEALGKSDIGGVGATDLGSSFAFALQQLDAVAAGQPADTRMLLYIGDGVVTAGERRLDALRDQVRGRLQFVGVGIGTGVDVSNLQNFAAATDGYATQMDLGEDLSWRTFDVIATLHTARAAQVKVTAIDASGTPVPGIVGHVRDAQLAEGEELEWVGMSAISSKPTALPVALLVTGVVAGSPWSTNIALTASSIQTSSNAGYLPRLWAQRQIAQRMLDKQAPAPACIVTRTQMCASDAQRREARDEVIRQEVVALGKKHFLLSRHTSLLVLEPGAGDRSNTVATDGKTWSPYGLPPTIEVKTHPSTSTPVLPSATTDLAGVLHRSPVPLFSDPYPYYNIPLAVQTMSTIGPTAGTGTGAGYGMGADATAGPRRMAATESDITGLEKAEPEDRQSPPPISEPEYKDANAATDKETRGDTGFAAPSASASGRASGGSFGSGKGSMGGLAHSQASAFGENTGYLQRYRNVYDSSFDDLTEYIPAVMDDDMTQWRNVLQAPSSATPKPNAVRDASAMALLAKAQAALPAGTYQWGDRFVSVDNSSRLGWKHTTGFGLNEVANFDGTQLSRRYPELQLQFDRRIAVGSVDALAMSLGYAPMWIGDATHFATEYSITSPSADMVAVTWPGATYASVVYRFDSASRVVSVSDRYGEVIRIVWNGNGPVSATMLGQRVAVSYVATDVALTTGWNAAPQFAVVNLPVPAFALSNAAGTGLKATPRQMLLAAASSASAEHLALVTRVVDDLLASKTLVIGDLVLASSKLRSVAPDKFAAWIAAVSSTAIVNRTLPQCGYLGPPCMLGNIVHDPDNALGQAPLLQYFDVRKALRSSKVTIAGDGLLAALTRLLQITERSERSESSAALVKSISRNAGTARLVAASLMSQNYNAKIANIADAWDGIAEGSNRNIARLQAALVWNRNGRDAGGKGSERLAAYMTDIDVSAPIPAIGYQAFAMMTSSPRGLAGWQVASAAMRARIMTDGDVDSVLDLLNVASVGTSDSGEQSRILDRAWGLAGGHPATVVPVLVRAMQSNSGTWAMTKVESVIAKLQGNSSIHRLASTLYASQMQPQKARLALERALQAEDGAATTIGQVRNDFASLVRWVADETNASSMSKTDAKLELERLGRRWRELDGGNAAVDNAVADAMFAIGDNAAAWRQLSTAIERQPLASAGWVLAAEAYQRHGDISSAVNYWHEAVILDQTNPRWRLRQAQAMLAGGQRDAGMALLKETLNRRWHQQYQWEIEDARYLLRAGDYR
jgi:hypothetical protein